MTPLDCFRSLRGPLRLQSDLGPRTPTDWRHTTKGPLPSGCRRTSMLKMARSQVAAMTLGLLGWLIGPGHARESSLWLPA